MRLFARGAAVALGAFLAAAPAVAADADDALKQAAQHFADLEDDRAKSILEGLSAQGVAEADVLLGYLYADPLYAGRDYQKAVAYFEGAAAAGNVEAVFQLAESRFWPDYSDWTLTPDEKAVRPTAEDAFGLLQRVASANHNAGKWRLAWLCTFGGYDCGEESRESVASLEQLMPAHGDPVQDHHFACTKLSMIEYFRSRYQIDYAETVRHARCREHMLSARGR
jgi:TPR repeat protein